MHAGRTSFATVSYVMLIRLTEMDGVPAKRASSTARHPVGEFIV